MNVPHKMDYSGIIFVSLVLPSLAIVYVCVCVCGGGGGGGGVYC